MHWECWSSNKCCLLISEVLEIKGIVPMLMYPVLSGRILMAQPERIIFCFASVKGVGKDPVLKWLPLVFNEAEGGEIVLAWPWQQKADWWKGQFFLAKESDYQMLLLPRAKQYESLVDYLDNICGDFEGLQCPLCSLLLKKACKSVNFNLFAFLSAIKWESCIADKRCHSSSLLIHGAKLLW